MKNTPLKLTIILLSFLISISHLGLINNVSAQSQRIDFTQKSDNLEPRDKNELQYAPDRIIVKYKGGQSPLVLQERVEERTKQRSSFIGKVAQQVSDITSRVRGQELPEIQLDKLDSFAKMRSIKG